MKRITAADAKRKAELLDKLRECAKSDDIESAHYDADNAMLDYINDPEIRKAYSKIEKWYA
jgi:hypothetical protein